MYFGISFVFIFNKRKIYILFRVELTPSYVDKCSNSNLFLPSKTGVSATRCPIPLRPRSNTSLTYDKWLILQ